MPPSEEEGGPDREEEGAKEERVDSSKQERKRRLKESLWLNDLGVGGEKEFTEQNRAQQDEDSGEYAMEEGLNDEDIALVLLGKEHLEQQLLALEMAKMILRDRGEGAVQKLVPAVCKAVSSKTVDAELLASSAEIFLGAAEEGLLGQKLHQQHLFPLVLKLLKDKKKEEAALEKWAGVALHHLKTAPHETLRNEVLPFVLEQAGDAMSGINRVVAAQMLGELCSVLPFQDGVDVPRIFETRPKKERLGLIERGLAMCQDTDHRVRMCMALKLVHVAGMIRRKEGGVDEERMQALCEELVELLRDEESEVRNAALGGAVELLPDMNSAMTKDVLKAVKDEVYSKMADRPQDACNLMRHLAPLLVALGSAVDDATWDFFLGIVKGAVEHSEDIRLQCAFNMPGLAKAAGPIRYGKHVHATVLALSKDEEASVRAQVAKSIPGLVQALGDKNAPMYLLPLFSDLLMDDDPDVRCAAVGSTPCVFKNLVNHTGSDQEGADRIGQFVCKYLGSIQGKHSYWRDEITLLEALGACPQAFSTTAVQGAIVPALYKSLYSSNQVAARAGDALFAHLRESRNGAWRVEMCGRFVKDFGKSASCFKRSVFCDLCKTFVRHFSRQFFRLFFVDTILDNLRDPVAIVRCKACSLLPLVRKSLLISNDLILFDSITTTMHHLKTDGDRQVQGCAMAAGEEILKDGDSCDRTQEAAEEAKEADEVKVHGPLSKLRFAATESIMADGGPKPTMLKTNSGGVKKVVGVAGVARGLAKMQSPTTKGMLPKSVSSSLVSDVRRSPELPRTKSGSPASAVAAARSKVSTGAAAGKSLPTGVKKGVGK